MKGIYYQVITCGALRLSMCLPFVMSLPDAIVKYSEFYHVTQAEVQGQKITWLTPHALQQVLTDDVDFNVMLSFLEFYEVKNMG